MKKWIALISFILAFSLFGCGTYTKTTTVPPSEVIENDQPKSTETMKTSGEVKVEKTPSEGSTQPITGEQPLNETNRGTTAITKSDNVAADAPKQETLNESHEGVSIITKSDNIPTDSSKQETLNETHGGVTIITKSDNVYTDAQKLETLDELTGEIDKLIESLNTMEDVQNSELTFD